MKTTTPPPSGQIPQLLSGRPGSDPISEIKNWCLERADEWFEQNQPAFACQFLQHALGLDPNDVTIWIALGSVHFTSGNLDQALLAFTQADELRPNDAAIQLHLAVVQQHRENWSQAEFHFRRSLELYPDNVQALRLYSGLLMAHGRNAESREILEQALSLDLDDVDLFLRLGVCCFRMNELNAAQACFKRALQLDPNNELAAANLNAVAALQTSPADSTPVIC
jgi:Tfp pilus assembly protein PilF